MFILVFRGKYVTLVIQKNNIDCMSKKKVSLVLSSGGARGIAHIAVIDELERRGYEICSIAGTSAGAMIGGIYASGNLEIFKEWMFKLKPVDIVKLFDFSFGTNGLVKGEKIFMEMGKLFPDQNIEDLPLPYIAISTDIINNKEVIHDKGSLFHAIRASISIPTFFKPLKDGDDLLVDGGLLNPLPVNRIKRCDGDLLFVVNVETLHHHPEFDIPSEQSINTKKPNSVIPFKYHGMPGYLQLVNKTIGIMLSRLADLTLEKYEPDLVINIHRDLFGTYDFHKYSEIIETGQRYACAYLDRYELLKAN
jgi:NTE family protein